MPKFYIMDSTVSIVAGVNALDRFFFMNRKVLIASKKKNHVLKCTFKTTPKKINFKCNYNKLYYV